MSGDDNRKLQNLIENFFRGNGDVNDKKKEIEILASQQEQIFHVTLSSSTSGVQPFDDTRLKSLIGENRDLKLEIPNIGLTWKNFYFSFNPSDYISKCATFSFERCKFSIDLTFAKSEIFEINFNTCSFHDEFSNLTFSNLPSIKKISITNFQKNLAITIENIKGKDSSLIDISNSDISSLNIDNVNEFQKIRLHFSDGFIWKKFICENSHCTDLEIKNLGSSNQFETIQLEGINYESIHLEGCNEILIGGKAVPKKIEKVTIQECCVVDLKNIEIKNAKIDDSNHICFENVITQEPQVDTEKDGRKVITSQKTSFVDSNYIKISGCKFEELSIENPSTSDSKNSEGTIGGYLYIQNSEFKKAPDIKAKLPKGSLFNGSIFYDKKPESIGRYRDIKNKLLDIGNDGDAMTFSSYEMISTHANIKLSKNYEERIIGFFAKLGNNFGLSLFKLFVILAISWVLCSVVYYCMCSFEVYKTSDISDNLYECIKKYSYFCQALLFSFYNSLGPFGALFGSNAFRVVDVPSSFIVFVQRVVSSILLYLFIIGIRKKFRQV